MFVFFRALDRIWEVDLLAPMIRFVRIAVTVAAIAAMLLLLAVVSKVGDGGGILLFLIGSLVIISAYVMFMLAPDVYALIMNLQRSTRPLRKGDVPVRYLGLHWFASLLRLSVILTLLCYAAWLPARLAEYASARYFMNGLQVYFLESPAGISLWTILVVLAMLGAIAGIVHLVRREVRQSPHILSPASMLGILFATHTAATLVAATHRYFFVEEFAHRTTWYQAAERIRVFDVAAWGPFAAAIWVALGAWAGYGLYKRRWDGMKRAAAVLAAIAGTFVLYINWLGLLGLPAAFIAAVASISPVPASTQFQLAQLGSGIFGGNDLLLWAAMAAITVLFCAIAWMKSDAARALEGLERNLRSDTATKFSIHVSVANAAAYAVSAAIVVGGIALLVSAGHLRDLVQGAPEWLRPAFEGIASARPEWIVVKSVVWMFAVVAVIRLTFDLVVATRVHGRGGPSLNFFSLRFVTRLQIILSAGVAILVAFLGWNIAASVGRHADSFLAGLLLRLMVLAAAAAGYVVMTLVATIIHNTIEVERNTRPAAAGVVRAAAGYPALSFIATFGKGVVWLLTIVLAVAAIALASEMPESLVLMAPLTALVHVLLSVVPDMAAILLTVDRNFAMLPAAAGGTLPTTLQPEGAIVPGVTIAGEPLGGLSGPQ